jgi:hypothetical protein
MNSPLENREVRLRGLPQKGGVGAPGPIAAGESAQADFVPLLPRFQSLRTERCSTYYQLWF